LTCGVSGCSTMDITMIRVRIKTEKNEIKDGDLRVCSEHEKYFSALKKSSEGFKN